MQAIKTKMMVGDLVVVPDRVFMGVRDLGGVARIIRVERYNARGASQDINKPVVFDIKAPKELITTLEMVDSKQRQYYLKAVKPKIMLTLGESGKLEPTIYHEGGIDYGAMAFSPLIDGQEVTDDEQ